MSRFRRDDAGGFWSRKGHFILNLKDEKPARVRGCLCVFYSTGHSGYRDWKKRCQRIKIKQKGRTPLQLPISRQLKPTAPLLPPSSGRDQLLQDLQELILAMTDKIQASGSLGENSFVETDLKKTQQQQQQLVPGQNRDFLDPRSPTR